MHPLLMEFDCCGQPMAISAYAAGIVGAASIFMFGGWAIASRRGLPGKKVFACLVMILVASLIGARGMHWAIHPEIYRDRPELLWSLAPGRFALQGAVLAALAAGLLGCRLLKIDVYRFADATAPAIALGIASSRIGCFFTGCCFGRETDLPWGVTFPPGSPAHLHMASRSIGLLFDAPHAVHPTQLYEALAAVAAAGLAISIVGWTSVHPARHGVWTEVHPTKINDNIPSGTAFLASATCLAAFQGLNSFFRAPTGPSSAVEIAYPLIHAGFVLAGILLLIERFWKARGGPSCRVHDTIRQGDEPDASAFRLISQQPQSADGR